MARSRAARPDPVDAHADAHPGVHPDEPQTQQLALVAALRAGDEAAFTELVVSWSGPMLRLARAHVSTDATAQEVVQETWLAVLSGLDTFQGRSALRTWVFSILLNTAKSRGVREARSFPVAALTDDGPTVDPARFTTARRPADRHWTSIGRPTAWPDDPSAGPLRTELRALLTEALTGLPERQRDVILLRDVEGFTAEQTCTALELTPANQRVLLHRARAKVRQRLEDYYRGP